VERVGELMGGKGAHLARVDDRDRQAGRIPSVKEV
jgi:hypothetical protein